MRRRRAYQALCALVLTATPVMVSTGVAHAVSTLPETQCDVFADTNSTSVGTRTLREDLGTGEQGGVPDSPLPIETAHGNWTTVDTADGKAYSVVPHPAWITVPDANWINSTTTYASTGSGGVLGDAGVDAVLTSAAVPAPALPVSVLPATMTFRRTFTLPTSRSTCASTWSTQPTTP